MWKSGFFLFVLAVLFLVVRLYSLIKFHFSLFTSKSNISRVTIQRAKTSKAAAPTDVKNVDDTLLLIETQAVDELNEQQGKVLKITT